MRQSNLRQCNDLTYDFSMRAFLLRSLVAALLIGPAIGFISEATSVEKATKYYPPLSTAEIDRMKNLPFGEVEAAVHRRAIPMSRWEWLKDSIRYSYFWRDVAGRSIVPTAGVFLACLWVGWIGTRGALKIRPEGNLQS